MIETFFQQDEAPLVQVKNLTRQFGRQLVLQDISLDIPAGQTLVLLGRPSAVRQQRHQSNGRTSVESIEASVWVCVSKRGSI